MTVLNILLVDDDEESLSLLSESLPDSIGGKKIRWEPCGSFSEAFQIISDRRFDVVVSDIYRDRQKKEPVTGDPQGTTVLEEIRKRRFCPVLLFTDGVFPDQGVEGPFVKVADKSPGNSDILVKLEELMQTGIPELAHKLHDELDTASGSYLWSFLNTNWAALESAGLTQPEILDRLIHRRASVQLGRLEASTGGLVERASIEGAEFYLQPRIADVFRLGQVIEREGDYRVILTPHCHLVIQPGQSIPRADYILTARTEDATSLFRKFPLQGSNREKKLDDLRRRIQSPAAFGKPQGRYWFLPGFLEMPNLYVDFLQLESIEIQRAQDEWHSISVLDTPFAEALQSCFVGFYSAVGLPILDPSRFSRLVSPEP